MGLRKRTDLDKLQRMRTGLDNVGMGLWKRKGPDNAGMGLRKRRGRENVSMGLRKRTGLDNAGMGVAEENGPGQRGHLRKEEHGHGRDALWLHSRSCLLLPRPHPCPRPHLPLPTPAPPPTPPTRALGDSRGAGGVPAAVGGARRHPLGGRPSRRAAPAGAAQPHHGGHRPGRMGPMDNFPGRRSRRGDAGYPASAHSQRRCRAVSVNEQ